MYDKSLEPISAMMDGEIEELELRRTINNTANAPDLSEKWRRYHMAQDVMQGRSVNIDQKIDLVSRVSAALEAEPSYNSTTIAKAEQKEADQTPVAANDPWWKPMASMAVAASVTAVVLLGAQQYNQAPVTTNNVTAGIASTSGNDGFPKGQFGSELSTVSVSSQNAKASVTQPSYGMEQYIQRHRDLTTVRKANWQAGWLPQGYKQIAHKVTNNSEVMLFSNGQSAVSVNVEPLGKQMASQGVLGADDLLALGVRSDRNFVTVVGRLPPKVAEKIATSVMAKNH